LQGDASPCPISAAIFRDQPFGQDAAKALADPKPQSSQYPKL